MKRTARTLPVSFLALALVAALALPAPGAAQEAKRPLTHDDYDAWRSIVGATLSDDGRWLLYADMPQDGDAELVVREMPDGAEHRHGIGWLTAGGGFVSGIDAEFTPAGGHVVFRIAPDKATVEQAEDEEQTGDDAPKASMGILDLATGRVVTVERVKGFRVPEDGDWIAYLMEDAVEDDGEEDDGKQEAEEPMEPAEPVEPEPVEPRPGVAPAQEGEADEEDDDEKEFGTELRVRWLADGSEIHAVSALDYRPGHDGAQLLFTVSSEEAPETDGVYAIDTTARAIRALATGEGNYHHLTLAEESDRYAFVTDRADFAADEPVFELYGGEIDGDAAELWVSHETTDGFPDGMAVSDKEGVTLSEDGAVVMFGIRPRPADDGGEDGAADEDDDEVARFDLWHWRDPYPQPQQLLVADEFRDETFESVWWIEDGRFVQLADQDLPDVRLSDDGEVAIGESDVRWSARHSYEGFFNDVYVVDTATGERTRVAERVSWGADLSPGGGWVLWFGGDGEWVGYDRNGGGGFTGGQDWFLYDVESGERRNLTDGMDASFIRHDWDTPALPAPYGAAGFTADDSAAIIYGRHDVWRFPTDGGEPVRITDGAGGERGVSFRWIRTDPEEPGVAAEDPILLASTDEDTQATGFWLGSVRDPRAPVELLSADASLAFVDVADDGVRMIFTRETFSEFPDLWTAEVRFGEGPPELADLRRVTDLGAQTEPFAWGRAELREFRSSDGIPLKGILVKPEDFDPEREYPLMVYIYETLHTGLHRFRAPSPGTSINPSYYVSNGYVLWMPDIEYATPGYPGKDALKCVLPGINMLVAEGWVDEEAIGIQGHSWGGYQIAYMLTQTDVFAAAESGAPVSNMTSAYGGIRWSSGLVRQFQYERTQSRLGASLWDVPLRYIENSPLFWADEIDTPVLILHNDEDGAVPWYQGIELIMALRRLEKEAYLFNYNGEAHGLRQRINQEDWTVRMQEFFDHHLRGAPAPRWMTEGIRGWDKAGS